MRVEARQDGHADRQDEDRVDEPEAGADPPGAPADPFEKHRVHEREDQPVQEMHGRPGDHRAVARGREDAADEKRDADSREPESLPRLHDRGQHDRRGEPREKDARQVHGVLAAAHSASVSAALMSPTWLNACGKLPRSTPVSGSISSESSPTSFECPSIRSNRSTASPSRPDSASASTSQKPQIVKVPSPGGSPSSAR